MRKSSPRSLRDAIEIAESILRSGFGIGNHLWLADNEEPVVLSVTLPGRFRALLPGYASLPEPIRCQPLESKIRRLRVSLVHSVTFDNETIGRRPFFNDFLVQMRALPHFRLQDSSGVSERVRGTRMGSVALGISMQR